MLDRPFSMLAAGVFALGAFAGACTAALDFTECREDSDCSKFFEGDKPMHCENLQCVPLDRCAGNSQCAGLGEGYVCTVVGTCVQVETENCAAPVYPDDMPTDDVVLIGSIVSKAGPDAAIGEATDMAIRQAVAEFNAATKLQNGKAIALVPCDSKGDAEQAIAVATHLGDALAVPTILGPLSDVDLYDIAQEVALVNGVRAFTHSPTASAELDFPDMKLVWQTQVASRYQGRAIGEHLAAEMKRGTFGADLEAKPVTTMLFAQNDKYGYSMYYAIATEETDGQINRIPEAGTQKISSYSSADDGMTKIDSYVDETTEALILIGGSEVAELLAHYADANKPWPKRVYIGPRSAAAVQALGNADLAASLRLIAPDLGGPAALAVQARIGESQVPEVALAYDAAMTTLLAMAAIPKGSAITGPNITKYMPGLNVADGVPVSFGDDPTMFIRAAVDALAAGMDLQVSGASGPLDFLEDGTICGELAAYSTDGSAYTLIERFATSCPDTAGIWSTSQ